MSMDQTEQAVLEEAERVNEERMTAVRDLAAAVAERVTLQEQVKEAEKQEKQAARQAEKAGWTEAQIKRFIKSAKTPPKSRQQSTETEPTSSPSPEPSAASTVGDGSPTPGTSGI